MADVYTSNIFLIENPSSAKYLSVPFLAKEAFNFPLAISARPNRTKQIIQVPITAFAPMRASVTSKVGSEGGVSIKDSAIGSFMKNSIKG